MAPPVEGVWLIMSEVVWEFNPEDWDFTEVDNARYYRYQSPRHQEEIDEKYGKEVDMATRISRELLWSHAEIRDLGADAPTLEERKAISDKILTCSLWRYTERRYSFYRLFPCNRPLFCTDCLKTKLFRVTEDFRDHVRLYVARKKNFQMRIHHYVFHPAWHDREKNMSCVRPAFEAITNFRKVISRLIADYRRTPRRVECSIGPAIWGIHCLKPTWSEYSEPIPHLHLAFVTPDKFRPSDLNSMAERAASRAMGHDVRISLDSELQMARDKKSVDFRYFLDPVHRRKRSTDDVLLALCSYVASPIKHDTSAVVTVINGLTMSALVGGHHYGILNRQGTIPTRRVENFYKPDVAEYICKLARTSALSRWYKRP